MHYSPDLSSPWSQLPCPSLRGGLVQVADISGAGRQQRPLSSGPGLWSEQTAGAEPAALVPGCCQKPKSSLPTHMGHSRQA